MTEFRDIPNFPGYRAGSDGTIWSCWKRGCKPAMTPAWRALRPKTDRWGYRHICLFASGGSRWFTVHRLVLLAFVGPCPPGMECRHLDGVPQNNAVSNLCWGTHVDNESDKIKAGTVSKGERHGHAKLTDRAVAEIRLSGETFRSLAARHNVNRRTVARAAKRETWRHVYTPTPSEGWHE